MGLLEKGKIISFSEYLELDGNEAYECIDEKIYNMSPAPSTKHQAVQRELLTEFNLYLRGKSCQVFGSPIDVCFTENVEDVENWVQPDLLVVCDKNKIKEKRIVGAPDLIVEILSNSTAKKDKVIKFNLYEREGVREYWIVDPANEIIYVNLLKEGKYEQVGTYFKDDMIPVRIFEGFEINLANVFTE